MKHRLIALTILTLSLLIRAEGRPLNILFIAVDDLRPQLGCYGENHMHSPAIDSIAAQGIVFENAYCQYSVCGPSRSSLLSGKRPDTLGIFTNRTPLRSKAKDIITLPEHFKANGYQTISIGKIYDPRIRDDSSWTEVHLANDYKDLYATEENRNFIKENKAKKKKDPKHQWSVGRPYESANVDDLGYIDGRIADLAKKKLRALKDEPFFLGVGFFKPHLPFACPQKYWDLYDSNSLPAPENKKIPEGASQHAFWNYLELRAYHGVPPNDDIPEPLARTLRHGYHACVSYVDSLIGGILVELERLGLRENTAIVLWGDHGFHLGDQGQWCKYTNSEIATRSPLIISHPLQSAKGQKCKELVELIDLYPTLCELADLKIPKGLEAQSMKKLLENPQIPWKKAAFSQILRIGSNVMGYSIRTHTHRYTEWIDQDSQTAAEFELYDLVKDPTESVNVVEKQKEQRLALQKQLQAGWKQAYLSHR